MNHPMYRHKLAAVIILVLLPLLVAGCKDDAYTAAAKSTKAISDSTKTGIDTVETLYTSQSDIRIDRGERDAVLGVLNNVTDLNIQFRTQVKTLHANPATSKAQYLQVASGFVSSAQALLNSGALHVKNPSAQAKLTSVFQAIQTALNGISIAIQNAKGV